MPSWPSTATRAAKDWEKQADCVLHYERGWNGHGTAWTCWAHDAACPAIHDGQLRAPQGHDDTCCHGAHPARTA